MLAHQEHLPVILGNIIRHMISNYELAQFNLDSIRGYILAVTDSEDMQQQLILFSWIICRSPAVWIDMLNEQQIVSDGNVVDLRLFTSRVYKRLIKTNAHVFKHFPEYCEMVSKQVFMFLEIMSKQISYVYNCSKKIIVEELDEFNSFCKSVKLINKYIVYKMLRELSHRTYEKIRKNMLNSILFNTEPEVVDSFINYIIEKHELISLAAHPKFEKPEKNIKSLEEQFAQKILMLSTDIKKLSYQYARREDGKIALLLEMETPSKDENEMPKIEQLLVHINQEEQLVFCNTNLMRKKWRYTQIEQEEVDVNRLVSKKNKVIQNLRTAPTQADFNIAKGIQTVGGSLGNCIANIQNYNSINSFLADFTKRTILATSLNYLVQKLPFLGYLLILGGFSYTFYCLFNSKFKSKTRKLKDFGNIFVGTSTSIGAGLLGGLVGSAFIPIPVLGTFIGSVVGGFVGGFTGNNFLQYLQSNRFDKLIKTIEEEMQSQGYWKSSKRLLSRFGVEKQYFFDHIPKRLQSRMCCDKYWITLICFCLLSFKEAKQSVVNPNQTEWIELQQEEQQSTPLQISLKYLEKHRIDLLDYLPEVQSFTREMFEAL